MIPQFGGINLHTLTLLIISGSISIWCWLTMWSIILTDISSWDLEQQKVHVWDSTYKNLFHKTTKTYNAKARPNDRLVFLLSFYDEKQHNRTFPYRMTVYNIPMAATLNPWKKLTFKQVTERSMANIMQ